MSTSERYLLEIVSPGGIARAVLVRHLAPITADRFYARLPMSGMAIRQAPGVFVFVEMEAEPEKAVRKMSRGDVGFVASRSAVIIALEDWSGYLIITPLGRVEEGLETLEQVKTGDTISFRKVVGDDVLEAPRGK